MPLNTTDGMTAWDAKVVQDVLARADLGNRRLCTATELQAAVAGFLFQHGCSDRAVSRHYLDGLFQRDSDAAVAPIVHA